VPVRIELGPRDVADEQAVLVRRDDPNPRPEKKAVHWSGLSSALSETLSAIQANLFARAAAMRTEKTHSVESLDELRAIVDGSRGFISAHWCGAAECETTVKNQTGATIRCLPLEAAREDGRCIVDERPSAARVLFARAY
jgi:prolyl-tRNA synthetase